MVIKYYQRYFSSPLYFFAGSLLTFCNMALHYSKAKCGSPLENTRI